MAHPEEFVMSLFVLAVPDQMPQASNPPLHDLQSRSVPRFEGIDPA
jgi:hypothetical protein